MSVRFLIIYIPLETTHNTLMRVPPTPHSSLISHPQLGGERTLVPLLLPCRLCRDPATVTFANLNWKRQFKTFKNNYFIQKQTSKCQAPVWPDHHLTLDLDYGRYKTNNFTWASHLHLTSTNKVIWPNTRSTYICILSEDYKLHKSYQELREDPELDKNDKCDIKSFLYIIKWRRETVGIKFILKLRPQQQQVRLTGRQKTLKGFAKLVRVETEKFCFNEFLILNKTHSSIKLLTTFNIFDWWLDPFSARSQIWVKCQLNYLFVVASWIVEHTIQLGRGSIWG